MKSIFVKYTLTETNKPVIGNYTDISKKYVKPSIYMPIDKIKLKHN